MVSVLPSSIIKSGRVSRPAAVMMPPNTSAVKKLVEANRVAASVFWLPRLRLMMLPEPWPSIKPSAWIMAIRLETMPTAPDALVEIWPTKKVSAKL